MSWDISLTFFILFSTIALFIWDRFQMELVALMAVLALCLSGIITPSEAVSGFGQSIVVMIAALFVVGEALFRTGVAASVGNLLLKVGGDSESRLLLILMPAVALISAFMSSTGAVALFIPIVISIARRANIPLASLMMPLAFASLMGGMLTLIGTPPNIVVSGQLEQVGLAGFSFFDFTPVGLIVLFVGTLYMLTIGRWLLNKLGGGDSLQEQVTLKQMAERYGVVEHLHSLRIKPGSTLIGQTVTSAGLRTHFEVTVFAIRRKERLLSSMMPVLSSTEIAMHDELLVFGRREDVERLCGYKSLSYRGFAESERDEMAQQFGVVEVMPKPDSHLIGKTLKQARFRDRFKLSVIGIKRGIDNVETEYRTTPITGGDSLLLCGDWQYIEKLSKQHDLVVLNTPAEKSVAPAHRERAPIALGVLGLMLCLMVSGAVSSLTAVLLAVILMILTGCLKMDEAYKSLNPASLIIIAAMLPLAGAMEKSGALALVVNGLLELLEGRSPLLVCAGLFLFTTVFSQFISNTATTVLVAPVALASAQGLGLNPEPLLMTVAIAASTAFATPIASPVNTLVMTPGGYRFKDFVKVGVPLQLVTLVLTLIFVPMFFTF